MDFNQKVQTLMGLRASGKISDEVLAASLNALYEARKLNPETEEEKRQKYIEENRRKAAENRENVRDIKEKYRLEDEARKMEARKEERLDNIEEMRYYLKGIINSRDNSRMYDDDEIKEMDEETVISTYNNLENISLNRKIYLSNIVDENGARLYPDSILEKMDFNEIEKAYINEIEKEDIRKVSERRDYLRKVVDENGKRLYSDTLLDSLIYSDIARMYARQKEKEKYKLASEQAKAAADERERKEKEAREAAKNAASSAGVNGQVNPTPNDPYANNDPVNNPGTNPDPTKSSGPTTGTGAGTSSESTSEENNEKEEEDPENIKKTFDNQTESKNRRKIKNRRQFYTEKEAKDYGEEVEKLGKRRAFAKYFAKILIAIVSFWFIALIPPVGTIVAWMFLNNYVKDCSDGKHKGTIGQWIKKMMNAEGFKAKLDEKISEAKKIAAEKKDTSKKQSDPAKEDEAAEVPPKTK